MKLDATDLRYITSDEFRVLTSVEIGSKNHEVVPTPLIVQISGLRNGGVNKLIGNLAKRNLIAKVQNSKYDGYRLTYGGYDYLAMRALSKRDSMYSVGNQIGVGKEADVYIVADSEGNQMVLKLHRLGRISFRAIKEKRDYMGKRKSASWMYMSRLAAQKEWAFMKILHEHDFPVPRPIDQARHCILMEAIDAYPLRQIADVPSAGKLYSTLMDIIVRFARAGLIHGDYNEFNILIRRDSGEPVVIDFPQMVSTSHENAEWYFNRDVECIRTFFRRRFKYESALYPRFKAVKAESNGEHGDFQLDVMVAASGFAKKDQKTLEEYMEAVQAEELRDSGDQNSSDVEEEEEEEEEEDEDEDESEVNDVLDDGDNFQVGSGGSGHNESEMQERQDLETPLSTEVPSCSLPPPSTDEHNISDPISRSSSRMSQLSRSPPRSRSPSPDTLAKMAASLTLQSAALRDRVASDLAKRSRQQKKYHTKRSAQRAGRPQGSKAKQDTRVKLDKSGIWE
ncbi:RIO1 family-domain-containing protein [Suillus paluster]|uniref:RIO1 family-domain-containing protein n=1 Tax=Suillus paluster TaxID=48578 RepID=UPI001B877F62|nr:RIO1 family-domain-containing protein [Suillus paluster]KAG1755213.1 RIO1 family-domain-containing protein [Suillus paluster]